MKNLVLENRLHLINFLRESGRPYDVEGTDVTIPVMGVTDAFFIGADFGKYALAQENKPTTIAELEKSGQIQ